MRHALNTIQALKISRTLTFAYPTNLHRFIGLRQMSLITYSDLKFISRSDLASMLKTQKPGVSIIDVRDDDYIGGHIKGSQNVPVQTHDYKMPELVRTLRDQDIIIFHCTLSQQRGPGSALRYLRERRSMIDAGTVPKRKDGADLEEAQQVKVLDGGFSKWQQV
jgi:rhodanese-related sulfurtransferase